MGVHGGGKLDVAILFPDIIDGEEDNCLLKGVLTNEAHVAVAVVGCPNNTTEPFDVSFFIIFNSETTMEKLSVEFDPKPKATIGFV